MTRYTQSLTPITDTIVINATLSRIARLKGPAGFSAIDAPARQDFCVEVIPQEDGSFEVYRFLPWEKLGEIPPIRRALIPVVGDLDELRSIEALLPHNYHLEQAKEGLVVAGHDRWGWTLDGYVIPRLASGLFPAQEL